MTRFNDPHAGVSAPYRCFKCNTPCTPDEEWATRKDGCAKCRPKAPVRELVYAYGRAMAQLGACDMAELDVYQNAADAARTALLLAVTGEETA